MLAKKAAELRPVEAQPAQERVEVAQERVELAEQRPQVVEELRPGREAGLGSRDRRPEAPA